MAQLPLATMPDFVRRSVSRRRLLVGQLLLAPLVLGYHWDLVWHPDPLRHRSLRLQRHPSASVAGGPRS